MADVAAAACPHLERGASGSETARRAGGPAAPTRRPTLPVDARTPPAWRRSSCPCRAGAGATPAARRRPAAARPQALEREGVDTLFAYPGGASMEIHQALTRSESIRNILCRHEQVRAAGLGCRGGEGGVLGPRLPRRRRAGAATSRAAASRGAPHGAAVVGARRRRGLVPRVPRMAGAARGGRRARERAGHMPAGRPGRARAMHTRLAASPRRRAQGEIFAAEGYAKVTGRVGVCIATSGPGATNLVTGLADALLDSVPLVAITGQVRRRRRRRRLCSRCSRRGRAASRRPRRRRPQRPALGPPPHPAPPAPQVPRKLIGSDAFQETPIVEVTRQVGLPRCSLGLMRTSCCGRPCAGAGWRCWPAPRGPPVVEGRSRATWAAAGAGSRSVAVWAAAGAGRALQAAAAGLPPLPSAALSTGRPL